MKRKNDDEMVQTAVRLPQSLRDRLSKAGGERGLGEEVRVRLEASFEADKAPADPRTRELLDAISSCVERIAVDYGSWAEDPFAFAVLRVCVSMLLTHFQPEGEPVPKPKPDGMADLIFGRDYSPTPEEASRAYMPRIKSGVPRGDKETRR
jgi:hypothetical protein